MKRKATRPLLLLLAWLLVLANPANDQRAAHPVAAAPAAPIWSLLLADDLERGTGDWLLSGDWEMQTEDGNRVLHVSGYAFAHPHTVFVISAAASVRSPAMPGGQRWRSTRPEISSSPKPAPTAPNVSPGSPATPPRPLPKTPWGRAAWPLGRAATCTSLRGRRVTSSVSHRMASAIPLPTG
jgi:hypothetical protein